MFPYSERLGTKALGIDYLVDQAEKRRREHMMLNISESKLKSFSQRFLGTVRPVLLEHPTEEGMMAGFTDNYLRINVRAPQSLANTIVNVSLDTLDSETLEFTGTLVEPVSLKA